MRSIAESNHSDRRHYRGPSTPLRYARDDRGKAPTLGMTEGLEMTEETLNADFEQAICLRADGDGVTVVEHSGVGAFVVPHIG